MVTGFEIRVCAEGQVSMTVVCYDIVYTEGGDGKPSSVALKLSHSDGREAMMAPFYMKEIFVYTGWGAAMVERTGINIPTALGVWQVRPEEGLVQVCCIMLEDLTAEWEPFNPISATPTYDELASITAEIGRMHAEFLGSEEASSPPFSLCGERVNLWDMEAAQSRFHTHEALFLDPETGMCAMVGDPPFSEQFAANKHPWPTAYMEMCDFTQEVLMPNESAETVRLFKLGMEILSSRPQTIIHGDLNSGNVWKSKTPGGGFLFADWQLARMGPIGLDFFTMFLFQERETVDEGKAERLIEEHLERLYEHKPELRDQYPLQHAIDDTAIFYAAFMPFAMEMNAMALSATKAGLLPPEKAEFTWKVLYPAICKRFVHIVVDFDYCGILKSILDGTYDRWGPNRAADAMVWPDDDGNDGEPVMLGQPTSTEMLVAGDDEEDYDDDYNAGEPLSLGQGAPGATFASAEGDAGVGADSGAVSEEQAAAQGVIFVADDDDDDDSDDGEEY